jgi:hypothetical protein
MPVLRIFAQARALGHIVIVVQNQEGAGRKTSAELLEELPGEDGQSGHAVGREGRHGRAAHGRGETEVMKEAGGVSVGRVERVPEGAPPAGGDVGAGEGALARAGRAETQTICALASARSSRRKSRVRASAAAPPAADA